MNERKLYLQCSFSARSQRTSSSCLRGYPRSFLPCSRHLSRPQGEWQQRRLCLVSTSPAAAAASASVSFASWPGARKHQGLCSGPLTSLGLPSTPSFLSFFCFTSAYQHERSADKSVSLPLSRSLTFHEAPAKSATASLSVCLSLSLSLSLSLLCSSFDSDWRRGDL